MPFLYLDIRREFLDEPSPGRPKARRQTTIIVEFSNRLDGLGYVSHHSPNAAFALRLQDSSNWKAGPAAAQQLAVR